LFLKFLSLPKVLRIVAYCSRVFVKSKTRTVLLEAVEQVQALESVIIAVQHQAFADEYAFIKNHPRNTQPFMGDIPKYRLQQVKAFVISGVGYAGPIQLKSSTNRRNVPVQA
jgi:hypothetical protein